MKRIEDEFILLTNIMQMVAETCGERCEIILHDWSKGYEHSIVAIENGHITNRQVGDCGSNLGLEVMRGTNINGNKYNYVTKTTDNKTLRSSTTYIRDNEGNPIGALCMNIDITDYMQVEKIIASLTMVNQHEEPEFFAKNVGDLLDYLLSESMKISNKPVCEMNKEEKMAALEYLDKKGAFLITKSGARVCQFFNISKFTLYNYLDEIRSNQQFMNG